MEIVIIQPDQVSENRRKQNKQEHDLVHMEYQLSPSASVS
jgi:hypothetical protein